MRDLTLNSGERQVAPTPDGIRRDHVARYEWAARQCLAPQSRVVDIACGCGYGAWIMAEAGHTVIGGDISREAVVYARQHYTTARSLFFEVDAEVGPVDFPVMSAAVCFETIEHLDAPSVLLRAFRRFSPLLIASVPNQVGFPFTGQRWHRRHYTLEQFEALLAEADWRVTEWRGQEDHESEVSDTLTGRTLLAVCA